jgi:hypothetical protein
MERCRQHPGRRVKIFWVDGGLFKLSVGPVFWMLMELSRLELLEPLRSADLRIGVKRFSQARLAEPEFGVPTMSSHSKKEIWLRRLTWLLAIIALIQTVVYLETPFLPVSNGTLAVARKCLIPPKADADFDFLATNAIWRGKK